MQSGLPKISPDRHDFSIVHTFGDTIDAKGLPDSFSVYDNRPIPNQNNLDDRFTPPLIPIPYGCTAESLTFDAGIQDGKLFNPVAFYLAIPPRVMGVGRDIRDALKTAINTGFQSPDGTTGAKRTAYFNCYGVGAIDDFDAARIGLWINQNEKRSVIVGTYWYWGEYPETYIPVPSFDTSKASLHCYLITGWSGDYLEIIPWLGEDSGNKGRFYLSREIYNKLMAQPWTGAFTITKTEGITPIPIGYQAIIDHLIYFIRQLFHL